MASTGFISTGGWFDTGYGLCRLHGEIVYNVTRSNNTVSFTNTYARLKYVRESGTWTSFWYGAGWNWNLYINSDTWRVGNTLSGSRNVNDIDNGTSVNFTQTVGVYDSLMTVRVGSYFQGDAQTYGWWDLPIPTVSAPSGQIVSATNVTTSTATLNASLSSWGTNCTAGTGQRIEYKKHSDSTWTTLAYSTDGYHSRSVTGLSSGTVYDLRTCTINGAGLSGNSSTVTFTTLSGAKLITTGGVENRVIKSISSTGVVTTRIPTKI